MKTDGIRQTKLDNLIFDEQAKAVEAIENAVPGAVVVGVVVVAAAVDFSYRHFRLSDDMVVELTVAKFDMWRNRASLRCSLRYSC